MAIRWKTISGELLIKWPGYLKGLIYSFRYLTTYKKSDRHRPISACGMDIVTIVFKSELTLLRLQARSFDHFLDPTFDGSIVLIVNDLDQRQTIDSLTRLVLPDYGPWRERVKIVPFFQIGHGLNPSNGWIVQQALKLAISASIDKPFYLLLDAKNHLVRPATRSMFVTKDGRGIQPMHARRTSMPDHWHACLRFFGLDPAGVAFVPCAPMTPFVMHTATVRDLVAHLESREGKSLFDVFATTRLLSDFFVYYIYLLYFSKMKVDDLYVDGPELSVTVWPHDARLHRSLSLFESDADKVFFGFHRERLHGLCSDEKRTIEAFWRGRGLLKQRETLSHLAIAADPTGRPLGGG